MDVVLILTVIAAGAVVLFPVAVAGVARLTQRRVRGALTDRGRHVLAEVAEGFGLRREGEVVYGQIDGQSVRIDFSLPGPAEVDTANVVVSVHALATDLEIRPRQGEAHAEPATGDASFDRAATLSASDPMAVARLGGEVRAWLLEPLRQGWVWLQHGVLAVQVPLDDLDGERLRQWVRGLVFCAGQLGETASLQDRCVHQALTDPVPGVRQRATRQLVLGRFPRAGEALEANRVPGPSWEVLHAAHHRDHRALGVMLANAAHPHSVRADALLALVAAPEHALTSALRWLWRAPPDPMWAWSLEALAANDVRAAVPGALLVLRGLDLGLGIHVLAAQSAAVRLVGRLGEVGEVEEALVELLPRGRLRGVVIDELARIGTVRAVPALLALAERRGLFSEVPRAAREAVEAIQARVGDGGRGGLALVAELSGGDLSVARPRGGSLSPADDG